MTTLDLDLDLIRDIMLYKNRTISDYLIDIKIVSAKVNDQSVTSSTAIPFILVRSILKMKYPHDELGEEDDFILPLDEYIRLLRQKKLKEIGV